MEATAIIIYITIGILIAVCARLGLDSSDRKGLGVLDSFVLTLIVVFWPVVLFNDEENENENE